MADGNHVYVCIVKVTRPPRLDVALSLALCIWAVAESGPDYTVGVPAALLMTIPLAWRRSAPLAVAALVAIGFALQGAQPDPSESLATLVVMLVAAYSVGAADDRRHALAGYVLLVIGGCAETALVGDNDYGFIVVLVTAAAAAGYAMRSRSRQAVDEREREAALAVAAERERIARELHDSVAHAVSLMVVQAGAAETSLGDDEQTAKALERIRSTGHEAVADLGRMVGLLREEVDPVHGLSDPTRLVEPFRAAGLDVEVDVQGEVRPLASGLDAAAFRIAQEALTNALKHGSGQASLTITYDNAGVRIQVTNPVGSSNGHGTGHGLIGMRERARLYGGEVDASQTGSTYTVDARLPES